MGTCTNREEERIDNGAEMEVLSIERVFEEEKVPGWREQLTLRAFSVSLLLGVMFSVIVMKLNLTTGIIPSLNVSAGLLGFFFVRMWTKLLERFGALKQPFTRQENTVIQTCVVSCCGIAFSGGFGSYLFAMSETVAQQSTEANDAQNIKDPKLGWMIGFLFVVSFLGLFSLVPLRKWFYTGGDDCGFKAFPTLGLQAYQNKFFFDFSATYVGVGMICPYLVNLSVLLGGIVSWGIMWPLIERKRGDWFPADLPSTSLHGLQGYRVFIAISLILGDGLYNFFKVLSRTISGFATQIKAKRSSIPLSADTAKPLADSGVSFDDQRRIEVFLKDQIPNPVALGGYVAIATVSIITLPHIFHQLKWYHVLITYIIAPVLAFCNAYGCGLTDWSLAATYGKLAIFSIGAWAGAAHGGVLVGLAACGVMMSIVSTASDLTQDFKTGYMTLASPRSMFVSQVIGTAMGCIIAPSVFWLFFKAFKGVGVPGSDYPAPNALVYRNMAILGVDGVSSLPKNCLTLCCIFFVMSILINLLRDLVGKKRARFIPLPMAMAIPFYLGSYFAFDMCIGSMILFVWERIDKAKANSFGPAVASGLICGDGIWTLPQSVLALAQVRPPICMKFLSRNANVKVDEFLAKLS
ncbi:YELLOW STRIPE like 3 [Rhynchospora pubera]|uniref:YELLOW STRIPE like 3 n=1 Tax=Rhynchospora pubera TaxID=906938 RepID=A0AAV8EGE3_9POAL|nr:YELLOW STRIPE like 3 [Rhynchospora pubera]